MPILPDLTSTYKVESAGQLLDRDAWMTLDPEALLAPPGKRGNNLVVPRSDGVIPLIRRPQSVTGSLRMLFIGDVDRTGATAADPAKQLLENLFWFEGNIINAATTGNTVALKVTGPGGFIRQGRVQWLSFTWEVDDPTTARAVVGFEIPQRLA